MGYKSKFRRKYGLTERALAKQLGVMASTIGRWEKKGEDIFARAARLNFYRNGNKSLQTKVSIQGR